MVARLMPATRLGKLSVALIVLFALFLFSLGLLAALGQRGGDELLSNLALAIPGILAALSAILAFFASMVAVIWRRERSPLVFLTTVIALFVLIFLAGEVLSPQ